MKPPKVKIMEFLNAPKTGELLISEPFLFDPNFKRSVVLLCDHNEHGFLGFILNKRLTLTLEDVIELEGEARIPLYLGGPVQQNTLHIMHREPALAESSKEIIEGVYWGGDFEAIKEMIASGTLDPANFKFFLGYSGWDGNQLELEIDNNSWIVTDTQNDDIFNHAPEILWKDVLTKMGGKYKIYANSPENPQYN